MQVTGTTAYSYLRPPPQIQEQMFSKIDSDGDGSVSLSEFEAGAAKAAGGTASTADTSKIDDLFKSADTDGDGQLTEAELDAQFRNLAPDMVGQMVQMQGQQGPEQDFSKADSDGNGTLSLDEFKSMLKGHGGHHHHHHTADATSASADSTSSGGDDKVSEMFSKIDADGNGQMSQDELKTFFAQNAPPPPAGGPSANASSQTGTSADGPGAAGSAEALMQQIKSYLMQALADGAKDGTAKATVNIAA